MPISRRRSRLQAFGLVDTLIGLLLLVLVASLFAGLATQLSLGSRQDAKANQLIESTDVKSYGPWF